MVKHLNSILTLLPALFCGSALAGEASSPGIVTAASTEQYWTKERMKNAKPMGMGHVTDENHDDTKVQKDDPALSPENSTQGAQGSSSGGSAPKSNAGISENDVQHQRKVKNATEQYWTKERMENAKPLPMGRLPKPTRRPTD